MVTARWFVGRELAFALGFNIAVARLGGVLNNFVEPPISEATSLGWALAFGLVIQCASQFCGFFMIKMENTA